MPVPSRDEIRRKAIEIWMKRYAPRIGVYATPSDEELMETSVWREAQIELMRSELRRLEELAERASAEQLEYIMDEIARLHDALSELEESVRRIAEEKARARASIPRTLYELLRDMQIDGVVYRFTVYRNRVVVDLHPRFIETVKTRLFEHGVRDVDVRNIRSTLARISFNIPVAEYPTARDVRQRITELETMVAELAQEEKITSEEETALYEKLASIRRRLERMEISPREAMDMLSAVETMIERFRERREKPVETKPAPAQPPAYPVIEELRRIIREELRRMEARAGAGVQLPERIEVVLRYTPSGRQVVALDPEAESLLVYALGTAYANEEKYIDEAYYVTGSDEFFPADKYIRLYGRRLKPPAWWQWLASIIEYVRSNYDEIAEHLARGYRVVFTYPSTRPEIHGG